MNTIYDDKKATAKLKEAIQTSVDCDPADSDCEACWIGKPMELTAHDSGVKIVASVCSMIMALQEVCFAPKEYKYKDD